MGLTIGHFDKRAFSELLISAVGNRSINQYERDSGVSAAHISRLMRSMVDAPPTPNTIEKLASRAHNGVTYEDLMRAAGHLPAKELLNAVPDGTAKKSFSDLEGLAKDGLKIVQMVEVPVYKLDTKGEEILADSNIIGWHYVPADQMDYKQMDCICFKVPDDSMSGSGLYTDYIVTVKKQSTADDGQVVIVKTKDGLARIRRVRYFNDEVLLDPDNPRYQSERININELDIIGVVTNASFKVK